MEYWNNGICCLKQDSSYSYSEKCSTYVSLLLPILLNKKLHSSLIFWTFILWICDYWFWKALEFLDTDQPQPLILYQEKSLHLVWACMYFREPEEKMNDLLNCSILKSNQVLYLLLLLKMHSIYSDNRVDWYVPRLLSQLNL